MHQNETLDLKALSFDAESRLNLHATSESHELSNVLSGLCKSFPFLDLRKNEDRRTKSGKKTENRFFFVVKIDYVITRHSQAESFIILWIYE